MGATAPNRTDTPTKAELERELLNVRAEVDSDLHRARAWFQKQVADDIEWWYARAKNIAEQGTTRTDQVRYQMVKAVFDKILPDKREITRGAASVGSAQVQINIGGDAPADASAIPIVPLDNGDDDGE